MEVTAVSSDVGKMANVVRKNQTGLLIQPATVERSAAALETLLENPELDTNLGANGRGLMGDEFSLESYVNEYESFLEDVYHENT